MSQELLRVAGLHKSFDGFQAIRGIDFTLGEGRMHAVIGPNGAGKTTLFNLITGLDKPDQGRISFLGADCTAIAPEQRCRSGLVRSFQKSNTFPNLTVFENIQAAVVSRSGQGFRLWPPLGRRHKDEIESIALQVGISDKLHLRPVDLAYGDQRQLELAIALALRPRLLLLDEPTAGMSATETSATVALLERLVEEKRIVLLFTEHDMNVVFAIANRVIVLAEGSVIADGTPLEVRGDCEVKRVYLGQS